MPRQARLDAPGTLHHVMIRGTERQRIFREDKDRQNFLSRIARISEEQPATPSFNPLFAPNRVHFGKASKTEMDYRSREQAELVVRLANLGISGELKLPEHPKDCVKLLSLVDERLKQARGRFEELAKSRTGDEHLREQLTDLLIRWFVKGREIENPSHET